MAPRIGSVADESRRFAAAGARVKIVVRPTGDGINERFAQPQQFLFLGAGKTIISA